MLTAVSLFAGIGGIDLALERAGVKVVAAVEIDPAARGVLADRFPGVKLFNDVCEVTGDELRAAGFVPDRGILVGGWPCQDLSVAGRRAGLGGARSGLFWQVVRLLAELGPRWFLLENVPGLLSAVCPGDPSDAGAEQLAVDGERDGLTRGRGACPGGCMDAHGGAMGLVVGSLAELGYGLAWRMLDAQYFGVPQRRRRVFFVGRLGDGGGSVEVLLEPEGGGGDPPSGGATGPGASVASALSASGGGPDDNDATGGRLIVGPLQAQGSDGRGHRVDADGAATGHLVAATLTAGSHASNAPGRRREDDENLVVGTVSAKWAKGTGGPSGDEAQNLVPVAYTVHTEASTAMTGGGDAAVAFETDTARSLDTTGGYATNQGGTVVASALRARGQSRGVDSDATDTLIAFDTAQVTSRANRSNPKPGDPAATLAANGQAHVAYALRSSHAGVGQGHNTTYVPVAPEVTHALTPEGADAGEDGTGRGTPLVAFDWQTDGSQRDAVAVAQMVRRLTPTECERLQGFPDRWTATSNGQPQSDSARYRELGNSVAVPVVEWIIRGLIAIDAGPQP